MKYKGLRDNGTWEEFEADSDSEATPSKTGYEKVESEEGVEITD